MQFNTALGYRAGDTLTNGTNNVVIGDDADVTGVAVVEATIVGSNANAFNRSAVLGAYATGGENSTVFRTRGSAAAGQGSVVLGRSATSTAANQFVVGSAAINAGTVTLAPAPQTHYWTIKINGTDYKVLLST